METTLTNDVREFHAPRTMTPAELGDSLAQLVWESFSDFLAQGDAETPLPNIDALHEHEERWNRTVEETLVFFSLGTYKGCAARFHGSCA